MGWMATLTAAARGRTRRHARVRMVPARALADAAPLAALSVGRMIVGRVHGVAGCSLVPWRWRPGRLPVVRTHLCVCCRKTISCLLGTSPPPFALRYMTASPRTATGGHPAVPLHPGRVTAAATVVRQNSYSTDRPGPTRDRRHDTYNTFARVRASNHPRVGRFLDPASPGPTRRPRAGTRARTRTRATRSALHIRSCTTRHTAHSTRHGGHTKCPTHQLVYVPS